MVAIVWLFRRIRRRRIQQHQLVTQAVQHATGDVPEELEQGGHKLAQSWIAGVLEVIGAIVGFALLRRFWPQAPLWTFPVIGAAIYSAVIFQQSLVKRKPKLSDPIGPGAPSRYDWGRAWKAALGGLLVLALFNADRLPTLRFLDVQRPIVIAAARGPVHKSQHQRVIGHMLLLARRYPEAEATQRRVPFSPNMVLQSA